MLIQILSSLFVIFALWRLIVKFRRSELKPSQFILWFVFWLSAGIAFLTPALLTKFANLLGIGRGTDLVLYLAVVVVFYLIFKIFVRLEKMERNITQVIRSSSLSRAEQSGAEGSREKTDSTKTQAQNANIER